MKGVIIEMENDKFLEASVKQINKTINDFAILYILFWDVINARLHHHHIFLLHFIAGGSTFQP